MTICLSPDVEAALLERARQEARDVDELANSIIRRALETEAQGYAETVKALEEAMDDVHQGRVRPFREFMKEHCERYPDPAECPSMRS
jgi:hypothetical protein